MKYKYLNIIGLLGVLIVNYLANGLPINGLTTAEVSEMYPNAFVPAGITFSIWGIIYLMLIGFCLYPFIAKDDEPIEKIGPLFFISCLLNMSWILVWHHLYIYLSVAIMLGLLFTLYRIYTTTHASEAKSTKEKWLTQKPFSVYFGWICVATIANFTALFVHLGFSPPSPDYWAVAMIMATQLLVWMVNSKYHDIAFSLVILWALTGIIIKQTNIPDGSDAIIYTCIAGLIFTTLNTFYYRYRKSIS